MSQLARSANVSPLNDQERLFAFWLDAVKHGFGNGEATTCAPRRSQFRHAFRFAGGQFEYREEFAGAVSWGGDEVIVRDLDTVVWRLSAHGAFELPFRDSLDKFSVQMRDAASERLKEALSHVRCDADLVDFMPRGPFEIKFEDGWTYRCRWQGDFTEFDGVEIVSRKKVSILTQRFHGGVIR